MSLDWRVPGEVRPPVIGSGCSGSAYSRSPENGWPVADWDFADVIDSVPIHGKSKE
jgi:hypothetical protein